MNKQKGFMVSYEKRVNGLLISEIYPDPHRGEKLLATEKEARELANLFANMQVTGAGSEYASYVNFRVINENFETVKEEKAKGITKAELDAIGRTEEDDALLIALELNSTRTDGDGKTCWCNEDLKSGYFAKKHDGWCIVAREAVEKYNKEKQEKMRRNNCGGSGLKAETNNKQISQGRKIEKMQSTIYHLEEGIRESKGYQRKAEQQLERVVAMLVQEVGNAPIETIKLAGVEGETDSLQVVLVARNQMQKIIDEAKK